MDRYDLGRRILIIGLSFVFIYFGIDKFLNPLFWGGWIPPSLMSMTGLDLNTVLFGLGAAEIIIGVMILLPFILLRKLGLILAALHLVAVLTQTGWNDIAVRDIGLLAMAIGLFLES